MFSLDGRSTLLAVAATTSALGLLMGYSLASYIPDAFYYCRSYIIEKGTEPQYSSYVDDDGILFETMVYPVDIDRNGHMNNSRYLRELNFSRRYFFVKIGVWPLLKKHNVNLLVRSQTIRHRRDLRVWERYTIRTRLIAWSDIDRCFYLESRFERHGFIHAIHHVKYSVVSNLKTEKANLTSPSALLAAAKVKILKNRGQEVQQVDADADNNGTSADSRLKESLPPVIEAWNRANDISSRELNPSLRRRPAEYEI
jgi:acyl-CoA thioesterase FadM